MQQFKSQVPVITIDGPSGTGKGTIAKQLAKQLGFHFLDSGAIYRVLAFIAIEKAIDLADIPGLVSEALAMELRFLPEDESEVLYQGRNLSQAIRTETCGQMASKIAAIPEIRKALLTRQRNFAEAPGLVTDGRDMGTVVFPTAELKIFLNASAEERAKRRQLQLQAKGNHVSLAEVLRELNDRDARDRDRAHSPLQAASDAIAIDTTSLTIEQVLSAVLELAKKIGGG